MNLIADVLNDITDELNDAQNEAIAKVIHSWTPGPASNETSVSAAYRSGVFDGVLLLLQYVDATEA